METGSGVQVANKIIWKGKDKERIDVKKPNPDQSSGQTDYQDNQNNKYYYDPSNNSFYSFDSSKIRFQHHHQSINC